jgi:hypothetical protein
VRFHLVLPRGADERVMQTPMQLYVGAPPPRRWVVCSPVIVVIKPVCASLCRGDGSRSFVFIDHSVRARASCTYGSAQRACAISRAAPMRPHDAADRLLYITLADLAERLVLPFGNRVRRIRV